MRRHSPYRVIDRLKTRTFFCVSPQIIRLIIVCLPEMAFPRYQMIYRIGLCSLYSRPS